VVGLQYPSWLTESEGSKLKASGPVHAFLQAAEPRRTNLIQIEENGVEMQ
jgi:hypothetical protein